MSDVERGDAGGGRMTFNQLNAKVDGNQAQIVADLRALGFDVDLVHRLKRLYDLVVSGVPLWGNEAVAVRVEIKMQGEPLTDGEREYWHAQKHHNLIQATCTQDVLDWFWR